MSLHGAAAFASAVLKPPSGVSFPVGTSRAGSEPAATSRPWASRMVHRGWTSARSFGPKCATSTVASKVSSAVNVRFFIRSSGTVGPQ